MSLPPLSRRLARGLLLCLLCVTVAHGQTYIWDGQSSYPDGNSVIDPTNWQDDTPPPQSDLVNGDDVTFAILATGPNASSPYQIVYIPDNVPLVLHDINFNASSLTHPAYLFQGGPGHSITLTNNLTLGYDNTAVFDNSVNLSLTAGAHTVTVQGSPTGLTFNGAISGAGASVMLTGGGYVRLTGQSTFDGGLTVSGTTLQLGSSTSPNGPEFTSGPVGTGTLTLAGADLRPEGNITLNNLVQVNSDSSFSGENDFNYYNLTLNGAISGSGKLSLYNDNSYAFNGDNHAWSGGVYIASYDSEGPLTVNASTNTALGTGIVEFSSGTNTKLYFNSDAPIIYGLNGGSGDSAGPSQVILSGSTTNLTINQGIDTTYAGIIDGGGSLTKTGNGTLTLTSHARHNGITVIDGGAIHLDGSSAEISNGNTTVNSGGTLRLSNGAYAYSATINANGTLMGDGHVGSAWILNGGILTPGHGIGSLTFDHLELNPGSIVELQFKSPTLFDQVNISANTTTLVINATPTSGEQVLLKLSTLDATLNPGTATGFDAQHGPYTWTIFDASASNISGFTGSNQFLIDGSQFMTNIGAGTFDLFRSDQTLQLTFTPVPEPSTYALLAFGLGVVFFISRRRSAR